MPWCTIRTYTHWHTHAHWHTLTHKHTCTCICVHTHTQCTHTCIYTHTHTPVYTHALLDANVVNQIFGCHYFYFHPSPVKLKYLHTTQIPQVGVSKSFWRTSALQQDWPWLINVDVGTHSPMHTHTHARTHTYTHTNTHTHPDAYNWTHLHKTVNSQM